MEAETLNCPMCGAAAGTDSSRCEHCGARLATVACPSCFGLMFVGEKFCSHCGAKAGRNEPGGKTSSHCPRCRLDLTVVSVGQSKVLECPRCSGIWVDSHTLQQVCTDREKQAAVLGTAPGPSGESAGFESTVRYIPCPICKQLMNRVNFAGSSSIIVDVCRQHGTWFDRDELRRIIEFIRAGGLDRARARTLAQMKEEERRLRSAAALDRNARLPPDSRSREWGDLLPDIAAGLISSLLGL